MRISKFKKGKIHPTIRLLANKEKIMIKEQEELIEYLLTFHHYHYVSYPEGETWWKTNEERLYGSLGFVKAIDQIEEFCRQKKKINQ